MPKPFSEIRSAAIDGRALNPIFRKSQLKKLHEVLADNAAQIQNAIRNDTGHTQAEVKAEYWLGMQQLSSAYAALDPDQALRDEYAIAQGKDVPHGREAAGIVIIQPANYAFFSCLLSALVPALAAGNCVIVHTEQSLLSTPRLILDLIATALDKDTFHATHNPVNDADLNHRHVRVLQNGTDGDIALHPAHHLVSDPEARVVAIVERDADLDAAALDLVSARFALRGRSPYAPDLVLVNEWVKRDFVGHVVRHAARLLVQVAPEEERKTGDGGGAARGKMVNGSQRWSEVVGKQRGVSVLSSSLVGAVVDVEDRNSALLCGKVKEGCLFIHSVTSMDDAVDLSRSTAQNCRLGAAYVYTTLAAAKYICQFLDSPLSFVNHIPTSLLFLPMAPQNSHLGSVQTLYSERLFTLPKVQFLAPSSQDVSLKQAMHQALPQQLALMDKQASDKVAEFKRRTQGVTHFGFFNQGIATGGILLLSTVVTATALSCYYGFGLIRGRGIHFL